MKYIIQILENKDELIREEIETQETLQDIEGLIIHKLDDLSDKNITTIITRVKEND